MANSDYSTRGDGLICPVASLSGSVSPGAEFFPITGYTSQNGVMPAIGSAAMIGGEIVKVLEVSTTGIKVGRGCADTVPAIHGPNTPIWFFDGYVGTDSREYMATEDVGVKVLMRTTGATMAVKNSPPNLLAFNSRFARPYPPGKLMVGTAKWFAQHALNVASQELQLTWAHRDRVTQADQLMPHDTGSIGPEPGTTYIMCVYDAAGTLRFTRSGITTAFTTYTLSQAVTDLGMTLNEDAAVPAYITLTSVRGGYESWQSYRIDFVANASGFVGWNNTWGLAWGT